jgi:hypothetical protein
MSDCIVAQTTCQSDADIVLYQFAMQVGVLKQSTMKKPISSN